MEQPPAPTVPTATTPQDASAEQVARVRLVRWFDGLGADIKRQPEAFWRHAGQVFEPMNGDLAFEFGLLLGRDFRPSAMAAFNRAVSQDTPEGSLGVALCLVRDGRTEEALAQLAGFLETRPAWRDGAERVFDPLLHELFRSGCDIPAHLRRAIFAYSFVAYRQGRVLPRRDEDVFQTNARAWFASGLPSAAQPQVSVGVTLTLAAATAPAATLVAFVAAGHWPAFLLLLLAPYVVSVHKAYAVSKSRKALRRELAQAWRAPEAAND